MSILWKRWLVSHIVLILFYKCIHNKHVISTDLINYFHEFMTSIPKPHTHTVKLRLCVCACVCWCAHTHVYEFHLRFFIIQPTLISPQAPTLQHQMPQAPSVLAKWKLSLLPECQAFGLSSRHSLCFGGFLPFFIRKYSTDISKSSLSTSLSVNIRSPPPLPLISTPCPLPSQTHAYSPDAWIMDGSVCLPLHLVSTPPLLHIF